MFVRLRYIPGSAALFLRNWSAPYVLKNFGKASVILDGTVLRKPENISIGANSSLQNHCYLSGEGGIDLSDNVRVAPHCAFFSTSHNLDRIDAPICEQGLTKAPIVVEDDVWIGCHSVILMGVTIGKGSVIGANSLVNGDIPPYSIAAGSPARVIRQRKTDK